MFKGILYSILLVLSASGAAYAADTYNAEKDFDVEKVKAKYTDVNYVYTSIPERGYNYYKVANNAYYIHNEFDSMVFFITDVGVVVYDARPELTPFVLDLIPRLTDKKITHVIYSHHHRDHAEGMHLFLKSDLLAKNVKIIAQKETEEFLKIAHEDLPAERAALRPMPNVVWDDDYILETGGLRLEFKNYSRNWHSHDDSVVYAPKQNILFAIDTFHAKSAPWIHFGEATDPMMTWKLPQILLNDYPNAEFIITGHEKIVATHADLEQYRDLIKDMQDIMHGVMESEAFHATMKEAHRRYKDGSEWWNYREGIDLAADMAAQKFIERWAPKVRNASLNAEENFKMMFMQFAILNP
ncbi:MBL fold metallo-hydrolase [Vibrio sp. F74]|uniref:MBL fold metallo-hydrolase n=1 Tax=Vibrio sp. F74 TaxID=700020 RepID=UPI0035F57792